MAAARLETRGLGKRYPGTVALEDVTLAFPAGKVSAIVGRNGAGKSTLVRLLSGAAEPSAGEVVLDGAPLRLRSPREAIARGIATVHQELSLVPGLTVAENVYLGRFPRGPLGVFVPWRELHARTASALRQLGIGLDPGRPVSSLSLAQQQMVEIARAAAGEARVVLLDEPTAGLAPVEAAALFALVRRLRERGVALVYITHRLHELGEVADTVTGLRDGRVVETIAAGDASPARLAELMFGAAGATAPARAQPRPGPATRSTVLELRGLGLEARFEGIDLRLGRGEVVGIAGMLGSGRSSLLRAVAGAAPASRGEIVVHAETGPVTVAAARATVRSMRALGVGLIPEQRKRDGLVLGRPVRENLCLAALERLARRGLLSASAERRAVTPLAERLRLVMPGLEAPVAALSGGNQQKVVVGKWLLREPRVLLFDEPARGVDVGARAQMFDLIRALAAEGMAALIVSSELEELLELCDRILVLRHGRLAGELDPRGLTLERLLAAAMGAGEAA